MLLFKPVLSPFWDLKAEESIKRKDEQRVRKEPHVKKFWFFFILAVLQMKIWVFLFFNCITIEFWIVLQMGLDSVEANILSSVGFWRLSYPYLIQIAEEGEERKGAKEREA